MQTHPTDKIFSTINLDMQSIIELEDELGSLPDFYARLRSNRWKMGELVSFYHIALSQHRSTPDYMQLGNRLLSGSIHLHQQHALSLLEKIFSGCRL